MDLALDNLQWLICHKTKSNTRVGYDIRSIFRKSLTGLNLEFPLLADRVTRLKEPSLPCYLPKAGGRIDGFIPLLRVLELGEI